jgi:hypothetical protein
VTQLGLGCRTGTGTGTGELVPGPLDPVVGNARWRPLGSQGKNKKLGFFYRYLYLFIYRQVCTYAAPESGHCHSPCPLAIWGLWTIPLPPQDAADPPARPLMLRLGAGGWRPNSSSTQQPTQACRPVSVWH